MNDWLSGRGKMPCKEADSLNVGLSAVRREMVVNMTKKHQRAQSGIACFGSVGSLATADVKLDRFKVSSHRSGVSSSYDNSLSSSVLNGKSKPTNHVSKDIQAFNDQTDGVVRKKRVNNASLANVFTKITADPSAAAQSITSSALLADKRNTHTGLIHTDSRPNMERKFIRKRQRAVLAQSLSAPMHLEDWLGEQIEEYQEDTKKAAKSEAPLRIESKRTRLELATFDEAEPHIEVDDYSSDSSDGETFERISYNDDEHNIAREDLSSGECDKAVSDDLVDTLLDTADKPSAATISSLDVPDASSATAAATALKVMHSTQAINSTKTAASISLQLAERRKDCMSLYVAPRLPATRIRSFEHNPVRFSQFPFTRGVYPKQLRKWPTQLHVAPVNLRRIQYSDNAEVRVCEGCSCVRFDSVGALVAVGSSNGVVRIFDFDECLAAMHGPSKCTLESEALSPIVSTPPGAAVTDVRWSLLCDSEIAVAFAHRAEIFIYDLYRCQNNRAPFRVLQTIRSDSHDGIAAARRQGGNKVLCYLHAPSGVKDTEWLAAGGQSGCIHMWVVSSNIAHHIPVIPAWKVAAEIASFRRSAIIGLCSVGQHRLLSASVCGTFAIWDLLNISARSFGKESSPTLLLRIAHNLHSPISGITVPLFSDIECDIGGKIYATLNTGSVQTLQVWCRQAKNEEAEEEWFVKPDEPALVARPLQARSQPSSEQDILVSTTEPDVFSAPPCVLMPFGPSVFVTSSYPHNKQSEHWLHVRDNIVQTTAGDSQKKRQSAPALSQGDQASFTLPGSVVRAVPGERAVTVSHDLRTYLCSDLVSQSFPSRSSQVIFASPRDRKTSTQSHRIAGLQKLDGVDSHTLQLQEPYTGPRVRAGVPLVRIRTNLVPTCAPINSSSNRKNIKSDMFVRTGNTGVTVMDAHPHLPYILIGTRADEIHVVTATHDSDIAVPVTSSVTMDFVADQNIVRDVAVADAFVQASVRISSTALPQSSATFNTKNQPEIFASKLRKVTAPQPAIKTVQLGAALTGYIQNQRSHHTDIRGTENRLPQRRLSALEKNSKSKLASAHKAINP